MVYIVFDNGDFLRGEVYFFCFWNGRVMIWRLDCGIGVDVDDWEVEIGRGVVFWIE